MTSYILLLFTWTIFRFTKKDQTTRLAVWSVAPILKLPIVSAVRNGPANAALDHWG